MKFNNLLLLIFILICLFILVLNTGKIDNKQNNFKLQLDDQKVKKFVEGFTNEKWNINKKLHL